MAVKHLFLASVVLLPLVSFSGLSAIGVSNGGKQGTWGERKMCPQDSAAVGFSIQVEKDQGMGDDTALNGIRLLCKHESAGELPVESVGPWGKWTAAKHCSSGYLSAFQLRVEPDSLIGDNTGANNIRFHCTEGEETLEGEGMNWGKWGPWSDPCTSGICGMQTRVEKPQGLIRDDTGLNDVVMFCCKDDQASS